MAEILFLFWNKIKPFVKCKYLMIKMENTINKQRAYWQQFAKGFEL